jgi:transcriptional regulator with PAS, ATPase and Fis domain
MDKRNSKHTINEICEIVEPILKATSDAICVLDENGNQIYANSLYNSMLKRGHVERIADAKDVYIDGKKQATVVVYHDISEVNRLRRELDKLNQKLRKVETRISFEDIIGTNKELQKVISTAKVAAVTPATIMIRGESGTGKEIFANAIHNASPRRNEKFIKINCSSIPEELLESELFGYKEGAFTGAQRGGKRGLFYEANHGTLFLDEIGDVSARMQVKLLRALQEKEIMPIGSTEAISVNVRIICATNKPLEKMLDTGKFREDLYYRLNVFPLSIPPLRERKDDIADVSRYIINKYNDFYERNVKNIEEEVIRELQKREWPGNVRELENVLSRALINLGPGEENLTREDVLAAMGEKITSKKEALQEKYDHFPLQINEAIKITEQHCIKRALKKYDGDKNRAAVDLGIPIRTLYYKCKKLGI